MTEIFDHAKAYREYVEAMKIRKNVERRRQIEKAMRTRREDLHRLIPKPEPLLKPAEWDKMNLHAEVEALANSTSNAERAIISQRLQRQYGDKVKELLGNEQSR